MADRKIKTSGPPFLSSIIFFIPLPNTTDLTMSASVFHFLYRSDLR